MPPRAPLAKDYHVAWITAIPTEYIVACEFLDEKFNPPLLPQDDTNIYTFGAIGSHKVVIACSSNGRFGTASATSVAINMQRSFMCLQFTLSVGIGGGAPTKEHDIRLGDVVVSIPAGYYSGVVPYEHGKIIQNRQFERSRALDAPAPMLLMAAQKLSAIHERKGHQIRQIIDSMIRRNPRLGQEYQVPGPQNDVLFRSSFMHQGHASCKEHCAKSRHAIVQRPRRNPDEDTPVVHYGLIGSADRLIKDAEVRDQIARTEGILCFETQAAGLINHTHCLVVRGVCNYADSHENKMWQGYAAATAAAYTKELLAVIPAFYAEDNIYPQRPMLSLPPGSNNVNHITGASAAISTRRPNATIPVHSNAWTNLASTPVHVRQPVERDFDQRDPNMKHPGTERSGKLRGKAPSEKTRRWIW